MTGDRWRTWDEIEAEDRASGRIDEARVAAERERIRAERGTATYTVTAKRWEHGLELHVDGIGVTQSRSLDDAEEMVRDYIETVTGCGTDGDVVEIAEPGEG